MQANEDKVKAISEALPYIKKFHNKVIVLKYGGSAMTEDNLRQQVAQDIVLLKYIGMKPVVIHGGGKEINKWLEKIGKKSEFAPNGLRITDAETMEVVEMVLGRISKEIVQMINKGDDTKAVSVSGKDGGMVIAEKRSSEYELGFVGDITKTDVSLLKTLLDAGNIPVISSIGQGEDSHTYNINADSFACAVAGALQAEKLILMTDVDGVLDKDEKLISRIDKKIADKMKKEGTISGGMLPKIDGCLDAIKNGARSVHILNGTKEHAILIELLTDHGIGTMITEKEV